MNVTAYSYEFKRLNTMGPQNYMQYVATLDPHKVADKNHEPSELRRVLCKYRPRGPFEGNC